ncbi:MAG: glycosyltransferase family 9 protein [Methanothrix sp.]|nr:glycosyltransferase family 9 protein [Methanothrix sp.]
MRFCVIHLNQIGDLVFSLPLLKTLRDRFPGAEIHSVMKPYLTSLLAGSPFVDSIISRLGGFRGTVDLVKMLRRNRYDLMISLARSEEAFLILSTSNASKKAGFSRFPLDFSLDVRETIEGHNSWHNNARLLGRLGIEPSADTYVGLLPIRPDECTVTIQEPFVVISAGASPRRLIKAWDEDKFASLAVSLHERYGLLPVLVGAKDTVESNELIRKEIAANDKGKGIDVLDLTGRLNLRELSALLMRARLFVGIDSGVMHLASAADIPVVGLFGPTDPVYVAPQNRQSIVVRQDLPCMPCYLKKTCSDIDCMRKLGVGTVMDACTKLMEQP